MTSQHTPGPWVVEDQFTVQYAESCMVIATVSEPDDFPCREEDEAAFGQECALNARLIAAAPEMLNALKAALAPLLTADDSLPRIAERRRLVADAIAKAEGAPR